MPERAGEIITILKTSAISGAWWIAYYLYMVSKGTKFKLYMFIINIILAWYVWYLAWILLPTELSVRDALISISWFSSFPLLAMLEEKFPKFVENYFIKESKWKQ